MDGIDQRETLMYELTPIEELIRNLQAAMYQDDEDAE